MSSTQLDCGLNLTKLLSKKGAVYTKKYGKFEPDKQTAAWVAQLQQLTSDWDEFQPEGKSSAEEQGQVINRGYCDRYTGQYGEVAAAPAAEEKAEAGEAEQLKSVITRLKGAEIGRLANVKVSDKKLGEGHFGSVYECQVDRRPGYVLKLCGNLQEELNGIEHYYKSKLGTTLPLLDCVGGYQPEQGPIGLVYRKGVLKVVKQRDKSLQKLLKDLKVDFKDPGFVAMEAIAKQVDTINEAGYGHNDLAFRNLLGDQLIDLGLFQKLGPKVNTLYPVHSTHPEVYFKGQITEYNDRFAFFTLLLSCVGHDTGSNLELLKSLYLGEDHPEGKPPVFRKLSREQMLRYIVPHLRGVVERCDLQMYTQAAGSKPGKSKGSGKSQFHENFNALPVVRAYNNVLSKYQEEYTSKEQAAILSMYKSLFQFSSSSKTCTSNCYSILLQFTRDFPTTDWNMAQLSHVATAQKHSITHANEVTGGLKNMYASLE